MLKGLNYWDLAWFADLAQTIPIELYMINGKKMLVNPHKSHL